MGSDSLAAVIFDVDGTLADTEYLRALDQLGVSPENALAIEDSELGLHAATAAGLATVVVTTDYTAEQDFAGAAMVRSSFDGSEPLLAAGCRRVHREWWTARLVRTARCAAST